MQKHNYKYNILAKLDDLSVKNKRIAKKLLPRLLNISPRTFQIYLYIKLEDNNNISPDKLLIMAKYFGCSIEELMNEDVPEVNYDRIIEEIENEGKKKFNL